MLPLGHFIIIKKSEAFCPADAGRCHSAKIIANVLESDRVEFIYSHYTTVCRRAQDTVAAEGGIFPSPIPLSQYIYVCFLIQFVFTANGSDNVPLVNNDVIRRYLAPDIGRARRPAASRIKLYESPGGFCCATNVWQKAFCLCIGRRRSCKRDAAAVGRHR